MKVSEMLDSEKPRERLLSFGVTNLSNEELISIILGCGTKGLNVKDVARNILFDIKNISNLKYSTINRLIKIKGVGKVKAINLLASIELGKRVYNNNDKISIKLNNSSKIFEFFKNKFLGEKQEKFYVILLDNYNNLIDYKLLFIGSLDFSMVSPREIFKTALLNDSKNIVLMHNHPSNNVYPSKEDIYLTNKLVQLGKELGINVIDHIIIGSNKYYSFYESK